MSMGGGNNRGGGGEVEGRKVVGTVRHAVRSGTKSGGHWHSGIGFPHARVRAGITVTRSADGIVAFAHERKL